MLKNLPHQIGRDGEDAPFSGKGPHGTGPADKGRLSLAWPAWVNLITQSGIITAVNGG